MGIDEKFLSDVFVTMICLKLLWYELDDFFFRSLEFHYCFSPLLNLYDNARFMTSQSLYAGSRITWGWLSSVQNINRIICTCSPLFRTDYICMIFLGVGPITTSVLMPPGRWTKSRVTSWPSGWLLLLSLICPLTPIYNKQDNTRCRSYYYILLLLVFGNIAHWHHE